MEGFFFTQSVWIQTCQTLFEKREITCDWHHRFYPLNAVGLKSQLEYAY